MVHLIKYIQSSCTTLVKIANVFNQIEHLIKMTNDF
jgi:hypothetical protein